MSWTGPGALLVPTLILCSLFTLISGIFFSDWKCTISSKFFDSQVPSISIKELNEDRRIKAPYCVFSGHCYHGHSLLSSCYLSRIGRIENSSCSACGQLSSHSALSSYGIFAPLALCFTTTSGDFLLCSHRSEVIG